MRTALLVLLLAAPASATPFNIVATGDSITTGYAPIKLTLAMMAQGITGTGYSVASGGATAGHYVGDLLDTNHHPSAAFHNQAVDAIEGSVYGFGSPWAYGSVIESAPEPDAVVVMLGTNDAIWAAAGNTLAWPTYQADMAGVFDYLSTAETPGGKHPDVFIATPIPILASQYTAADAFIDSDLVPWLEDQVSTRGFHLIDTRTAIQTQTNWTTWYNDGVHLFAASGVGYDWMATTVLNAVLDTHAGDANLDGVVDGLDYTAWSDHFGSSGNWSQGDFDHDGDVDGLDYTIWADHFGSGAAALPRMAVVPEPSSGALLVVLLACGFLWWLSRA